MRAKGTDYRLATTSADYKRIRNFLKDQEIEFSRLSFPSIFAERNGVVVGTLSTTYDANLIIAGPLAADVGRGNPAFVLVRLIQAYERVLERTGVSEYLFWVWEHQGPWISTLKDAGLTPWERKDGRLWFKKEVDPWVEAM